MKNKVTPQMLMNSGFVLLNKLHGAAHYRKKDIELRHIEDADRWYLTNGKSSFSIIKELTTIEEWKGYLIPLEIALLTIKKDVGI